MPTSPPLGASMLKGFVQRELPEWQLKVLDLNVWTFEQVFAGLAAGRILLDPRVFPEGAGAAAALTKAADAFRGKNDFEFYHRPDLYDRYGELFLRFTEAFTRELGGLAEGHQKGTPLSPIFREYLNLILAEKPDVIGISMIFSEQLPIGAFLGKLLRQATGRPVVFGGSCFADTAEHFLKWYPESADVIIAGEGEEALKLLLEDPSDFQRVPGAVFFKEGEVQKTAKSFPKDIDYYGAPDFADTDPHRYFSPEPVVPLLLSRGCYWRRCTFCVHYRSAGLTYRMHTMDFTIEMLKGFVAQGIRNFAFIDEMISPKHFTWLAKGIKEANLNISYYALTKPTREFTPEILAVMAESGCKYLLWGLESGCQRILDVIDKGTKVPEISQTLRNTHAAGIANHVFLICGFPTETEAEYAETLKFLDDHKDVIYAVHRGPFSLEPESPIFEHQERFGITRAWKLQDTSGGGRWTYECKSGMSPERVREVFVASLPLLRAFNPYARYLANFRDHARLKITPNNNGGFHLEKRDLRDEGQTEVIDDCKSGLLAVADAAAPAPPAGELSAQQIADFFADDPQYGGRYVLTGN
jgi:anaerobic magnesium-protoporphyrin IX monomethyl ester cyclase